MRAKKRWPSRPSVVMGYGCTGLEYTHRRLMPNESQLVADQRQRAGMNILIDRLDKA